jgi:hypothetical protein
VDIYVDESGDLGFSRQSTKFFIVAYVACENSARIRIEMKRALRRLHERGKYSYAQNELKFSRMNDYCRKYVLEKLANADPQIGVVIVEKKYVRAKLRTDLTMLYNWIVVHNLISALLPLIEAGQRLRIVFDKSLSKKRIDAFNHYIDEKASYLFFKQGRRLPQNCIFAVHIGSEHEPCLQATDAIAGAYFQLHENQNNEYVPLIEKNLVYYQYLWKR